MGLCGLLAGFEAGRLLTEVCPALHYGSVGHLIISALLASTVSTIFFSLMNNCITPQKVYSIPSHSRDNSASVSAASLSKNEEIMVADTILGYTLQKQTEAAKNNGK